MPILKNLAIVGLYNSQSTQEINEKVLNEALMVAVIYHTITLTREDLENFKALGVIVQIGIGYDMDIKAAAELGVTCATSICHSGKDSNFAVSHITNPYQFNICLYYTLGEGTWPQSMKQIPELPQAWLGCKGRHSASLALVA